MKKKIKSNLFEDNKDDLKLEIKSELSSNSTILQNLQNPVLNENNNNLLTQSTTIVKIN